VCKHAGSGWLSACAGAPKQDRLDSISNDGSSHGGGGHVRFGPDTDAPAPPGAQPGAGNASSAAALRRALSRNTIVPRDVFSDGASAGAGENGAPADNNSNSSHAPGASEPPADHSHQNGRLDEPSARPAPQDLPLSPFHSAATAPYAPEGQQAPACGEQQQLPLMQQQEQQQQPPQGPASHAAQHPAGTVPRSPSLKALQELTASAAEQPEQADGAALSPFEAARQRSVHWSQEPQPPPPKGALSVCVPPVILHPIF
jgi:hypothetical protein